MSDLESTTPLPGAVEGAVPQDEAAAAAGHLPDAAEAVTPAPESPVADPRDERIAALEAENLALRSQVADQAAELAAGAGPTAPPPGPQAAAPSFTPSGFDREGRLQELLRQGVPTDDAEAQADYEQRLYVDRQGGPQS